MFYIVSLDSTKYGRKYLSPRRQSSPASSVNTNSSNIENEEILGFDQLLDQAKKLPTNKAAHYIANLR